jgi:hypothetical protein
LLPEERQLLRARVLSADDEQDLLADIKSRRDASLSKPEPTEEQLFAFMHADHQQHWKSGRATPEFKEGIKAEWRAAQKPVIQSPPSVELEPQSDEPSPPKPEPAPPDSEPLDPEGYSPDPREYYERRFSPLTSEPKVAFGIWRTRFEFIKSFFKHLNGLLRIVAFAGAIGSLNWSWQVLGADEYLVAFVLLGAFVLFILVSLYGWAGIPQQPRATKGLKILLLVVVVVIVGYSAAVFWQKKGDKPWTGLFVVNQSTYCVFIADPTGNHAAYPLSVFVYGKEPMLNVTATIQPVRENSTPDDVQRLPLGDGTLLAGVHPVGFAVPPGKYVIQVWSRSGLITQGLELQMLNGKIVQTADVWGGGKQLYVLDAKGSVKQVD